MKNFLWSVVLFIAFFGFMAGGLYLIGGYSVYQSWLAYVSTNFADWFGGDSPVPTTERTRIFLSFSAILSVVVGGYFVAIMTSFIIEGQLKEYFKISNMDKLISKLRNHFIICGVDDTTREVIQELQKMNVDFVVIYPDHEKIEKLSEKLLYLDADPTQDDTLLAAGIGEAKGFVASLDSDHENLYITLSARCLNPNIFIVSKVFDTHSSEAKLKKAGANEVISPFHIGGLRIASLLTRPTVVTFLDKMIRQTGTNRFEEVVVGSESKLAGKTIAKSRIHEETSLVPLAVKKKGEEAFRYNITSDYEIESGDTLIVIGEPENIEKLRRM